jgi:hypothetical protein
MPTLEQAIFYGPLLVAGLFLLFALIIRQRNLGSTTLSRTLLVLAAIIVLFWVVLIFALVRGGL